MSTIQEYARQIVDHFERARAAASALAAAVAEGARDARGLAGGVARQQETLPLLRDAQAMAQSAAWYLAFQRERTDFSLNLGVRTLKERLQLDALAEMAGQLGAGPVAFRIDGPADLLSEGDPRATARDVFGFGQLGIRYQCTLALLGRTVPMSLHFALGVECTGAGIHLFIAHEPRLRTDESINPGVIRALQDRLGRKLRDALDRMSAGLLPGTGIGIQTTVFGIRAEAWVFARLLAIDLTQGLDALAALEMPDEPALAWEAVPDFVPAEAAHGADEGDASVPALDEWWERRVIRLFFRTEAVRLALLPFLRAGAQQLLDRLASGLCGDELEEKRLDPNPRTGFITGTAASNGASSMWQAFSFRVECEDSALSAAFIFDVNLFPTGDPGAVAAELRISWVNYLTKPPRYAKLHAVPISLGPGVLYTSIAVSELDMVVNGLFD